MITKLYLIKTLFFSKKKFHPCKTKLDANLSYFFITRQGTKWKGGWMDGFFQLWIKYLLYTSYF